jgi:hypothetical protein
MTEGQKGPMYGIKGAIDRLNRMAAMIRGDPRADEVQVVRRFASKREPAGFLGVIMALTQYHFPKAPASLHLQLAKSVAYRRDWLLYQRQHSKKLAKPRTPRNVPPLPIIVEPEPASQDQAVRNTYPWSEIQSQISSTQPSIRNLDTHLLENLNLPEQSGASQQDVSSVYSRNPPPSGLYPTQPSVLEGQRETLCKFCQALLPTFVVKDEAKWRYVSPHARTGIVEALKHERKHVDADLRPYVCVSEHCGDFSPSFSTVHDWKSHMEEKHRFDWPRYVHRARWACPRCPKLEKSYFPTDTALSRHLSENTPASHHPVLDAMEISKITAGCKQFNPIGEDDCPLCGPPPWQEEWKAGMKANVEISMKVAERDNLSTHFASHLRYLAFQSLRWLDVDINGEEDEPAPSQDAAGFNSKGSTGTATHEDSTAANINLNDEELKTPQDSRIRTEEEELLEREVYIPTSVTDADKLSIIIPASVEHMELTDHVMDNAMGFMSNRGGFSIPPVHSGCQQEISSAGSGHISSQTRKDFGDSAYSEAPSATVTLGHTTSPGSAQQQSLNTAHLSASTSPPAQISAAFSAVTAQAVGKEDFSCQWPDCDYRPAGGRREKYPHYLRKHIENKHLHRYRVRCPACGTWLSRSDNLRVHQEMSCPRARFPEAPYPPHRSTRRSGVAQRREWVVVDRESKDLSTQDSTVFGSEHRDDDAGEAGTRNCN